MPKSITVLKPSVVNALIPLFLRNLFYFLIIALILYGVYFTLRPIIALDFSTRQIINWLLILSVLVVFAPLLIQIVILLNTRYHFYDTYLKSEFKLVIIKSKSAPYSQIVNITTYLSIWDRLTKAGDITLHTAENKAPDIVLRYIKDPGKIERALYRLISKHRRQTIQ